jgi:hypothetical protein
MATSFAPQDFGTGRWQGGPATITNPRFEYREFTAKQGANTGTTYRNVTLFLEFLDVEGQEHKAQYDVGNAEYCQIKESSDDGADEAEVGPAFASPDPARTYKVYPDSDFGRFMASLVTAGFSASKLQDGDITVLDGAEVEVFPQPRKEGDKFPLLLIKTVASKKGAAKAGAAKAGAAKGKAAKAAEPSADVAEAASTAVVDALTEAGGSTTQANVIKKAMSLYKGQDIRAEVIKLLGNAEFLSGSDTWVYDAADKTLELV